MPSLTKVLLKGETGRHLQGIGFRFSNGIVTPFFERQAYGNLIATPFEVEIKSKIPMSHIHVKVANSGEHSVITGLKIGTNNFMAIDIEWRKHGIWQLPIILNPYEYIVGLYGYYGLSDSIKAIGFVTSKADY